MKKCFNGIYKSKRVFVTGHTGFKGSWLVRWLESLGATVTGYAQEPSTQPNHFEMIGMNGTSVIDDINDADRLYAAMKESDPEIVFHLAAQPLVRYSYRDTVDTFRTNVLGTVMVCEAARRCGAVRAIVAITTDKVYENREWLWGYRENDPLGGYDPYSSSKACAEIALSSYRNSFLNLDEYGKSHRILLSSVRAGNVIGGGDWSEDRLIPDIVKTTIEGKRTPIRSPNAIRPWQHVLECLAGYLAVGEKLLDGEKAFAEPFNFGPRSEDTMSVEQMVRLIRRCWPRVDYKVTGNKKNPHEAGYLRLDCAKAGSMLGWKAVWDCETAVEKTVRWYRHYYENSTVLTDEDMDDYISEAAKAGVSWAR
jgi:CDP-glucose 4,6-dehydratase